MRASTFLDRAIGYLSPTTQLKRLQVRQAIEIHNRYYEAGDLSRRTQTWKRPAGDANAVSSASLQRLRDSARQLVRNNGYAKSAIGTIRDDVVGGWGILPITKYDPWKQWSTSTECDTEGRQSLAGLQEQVMRTIIESGECLIRRRRRRMRDRLSIPLQIEVLEPDFIDSSKTGVDGDKKIVKGIEFDSRGRRVAYWLYKENPGSTLVPQTSIIGTSERVPASEIIHIFENGRAGQVRGVTWFAAVLLRFNDFDEFADATLMKQKIAACLTVLTTDPDGTPTNIGGTDPNNPLNDMIGPGLIKSVAPGQDIEVVNPPTVREYPDFVKTTLHEIAAGIGVTPEDLTGDYSNMNFSSARMSRLRYWTRVQGWRWRMMIPQFLDPLWKWAQEADDLAGGDMPANEDWTGAPLPMIEPDKEGLAIIRNIRGGITTPSEAVRERGFDPETFWSQYQADFADLDNRGIILDADPRKMTQAGQAQFVTPTLHSPPEGPPEDEQFSEPTEDEETDTDDPNARADDRPPGALMSVAAAAKQFNLNPETIRGWVRKGAIKHWRVGPRGAIRVRAADFINARA